MGIFDIFRSQSWTLERLTPPWAPLRSLYDDIAAHLDVTTGSLPATYSLPDRLVIDREGVVPWGDGSLDGVFSHHVDLGDEGKRARRLVRAVTAILRTSSQKNLERLYALIVSENLLSMIDGFLRQITHEDYELTRFRALARYLARRGGHRSAVKLGIAMLGIATTSEDLPLLRTLGACDEFALYAAVALTNQAADQEETERELFELAKRVHGWGRVHVVERLANARDPAICAWLLREGFRNRIMNEYLACICARGGAMADALARPDIDDALLLSCAEVLQALVDGCEGPAEGLDDYEDASRAVENYLTHVATRAPSDWQHLATTRSLERYVQALPSTRELAERGWTPRLREHCTEAASRFLACVTRA
ncbi:MAG TPA: hypothetical protein VI299_03565 [Polyangiales bacterium]